MRASVTSSGRVYDQKAVSVRKHRPDYKIVLYMGLLMLIGLVVMYAIGPQRARILNVGNDTSISDSYFFIKQATALVIALVSFYVMAHVPFTMLKKYASKLLLIGFAACLLLALAHAINLPIAPSVNGAVRWFNLGPLGSVQPAEFLKFAIVIFVAGLLADRYKQGKINDWNMTLIPVGVLLALVSLFIVVLQKNMSTGVILVLIILGMLFAAGLSRKIITTLLAAGVVMGMLFILTADHRQARLATFIESFSSGELAVNDENHQAIQARIAIGSGGVMGVGIGDSVQATGYLPESTNDSIFAIMGEVFGFVGLVAILAIFSALLLRLLAVADHTEAIWPKLMIVGIFVWLMSHIFINVASMIGLVPLTGVTLPLVSFGGTSMVFIAGALGLVFQLSQYTTNRTSTEGAAYEDSRSRRGLGRTRHTYRSKQLIQLGILILQYRWMQSFQASSDGITHWLYGSNYYD